MVVEALAVWVDTMSWLFIYACGEMRDEDFFSSRSRDTTVLAKPAAGKTHVG